MHKSYLAPPFTPDLPVDPEIEKAMAELYREVS